MINIGDRVALKHDGTISNTYIVISQTIKNKQTSIIKIK